MDKDDRQLCARVLCEVVVHTSICPRLCDASGRARFRQRVSLHFGQNVINQEKPTRAEVTKTSPVQAPKSKESSRAAASEALTLPRFPCVCFSNLIERATDKFETLSATSSEANLLFIIRMSKICDFPRLRATNLPTITDFFEA